MRLKSFSLGLGFIFGLGTSFAGEISGRALDKSTGLPISNIWILIKEVKTSNPKPVDDSIMTDAQGNYRFAGLNPVLDPGTGYILLALRTPYWVYQSGLLNLTQTEKKQVTITLEKRLSCFIKVTDSTSNSSPLLGAHLTLQLAGSSSGLQGGVTDAEGGFSFLELKVGRFKLTVAMPGYRTQVLSDSLKGIAWTDSFHVQLEKDSSWLFKTINGNAKTGSGIPTNRLQFFFTCSSGDPLSSLWAITNMDGHFEIVGIPEACTTGLLSRFNLSDALTLTNTVTNVDLIVNDPTPLALNRKINKSVQKRELISSRNSFSLLGRKLDRRNGSAARLP